MQGKIPMPTAAMGKTKAMNPALLDKFLDSYQPQYGSGSVGLSSAGSRALSAGRGQSLYDPARSWDGLSVDPRPFSRLDTKPLPGCGKHALSAGMAGHRSVVELGPSPEGGALCFGPSQYTGTIPLTETQESCARMPGAGDAAVVEVSRFDNNHVVPAEVRLVATPACVPKVFAAGIADDLGGALVAPRERVEALNFEYMRAHHPNGVLGVDSTANRKSAVYGAHAAEMQDLASYRTHHADRRGNLSNILVGEQRHGYDPFAHDPTPRSDIYFMQQKACHPPYAGREKRAEFPTSKAPISAALRDTNARIFMKRDHAVNKDRRQHLRDMDIFGKSYDVVTHAKVEQFPSSVTERTNKILAHPSQQSGSAAATPGLPRRHALPPRVTGARGGLLWGPF
ncbi:hypothetical protein SO694_00031160 [Aureococcus anophagefferens]|uniref:Flagellar associated protein n=1 Tax=Aureococcus anophagefferens TaxID=44056 RepID=A0ABR1FJJ7_AURAN